MNESCAPHAKFVRGRLLPGFACAAAAAMLCVAAPAHADWHGDDDDDDDNSLGQCANDVEVVASFDAAAFEAPESIAIDSHGNKYVSLSLTGEIRKISRHGRESTFAVLPLGAPPLTSCGPFIGIMGALAIDANDNLYVTLASCAASSRGVWRVSHSGHAARLASLPLSALPNGIAYHRGLLYVADAEQGLIWRLPADGTGSAEIWSDDPLLEPGVNHVFPGPNGVQFFGDELYVSNSNQGTILAIPVRKHGAPGPVRVHATGVPCDDFSFDVVGNIYCATDPFNTVVRIFPDGASEVLLTSADGLDSPSATVFGRSHDDRFDLYVTNGAFPFFSTTHMPSLIRVEIGIPGASRD